MDAPLEGSGPEMAHVDVPSWFPTIPLPVDGELTLAKVELGRKLFYDPILSRDSTLSCASCHIQGKAFTDGRTFSIGSGGLTTMRNAPTLANLAWQPNLFMDGGVPTLEQQVEGPLFAHNELDFSFFDLNERLARHAVYDKEISRVFGREPDAYSVTRAIAAFERTMVSGNSRFDRFYYQGDEDALSEAELRGWLIFNGSEGNCATCHALPFFTDFTFRNIGLYEAYADSGRARVTRISSDNGRFKVPTLRNVALTAPYMHDGSMPDLETVIEHFSDGVKPHPNLDTEAYNRHLTQQQKADLVAFLRTLTDEAFLVRESLSEP